MLAPFIYGNPSVSERLYHKNDTRDEGQRLAHLAARIGQLEQVIDGKTGEKGSHSAFGGKSKL
jgi:hypothetical protein